ncbi:hypothetical protein WCP94_002887 [Bilophila wadsworthia]
MEAEGTDGRHMGTVENARRGEWGTDTDGERISLPLSRMAQGVVGRSGISGGHPFETPVFSLN